MLTCVIQKCQDQVSKSAVKASVHDKTVINFHQLIPTTPRLAPIGTPMVTWDARGKVKSGAGPGFSGLPYTRHRLWSVHMICFLIHLSFQDDFLAKSRKVMPQRTIN